MTSNLGAPIIQGNFEEMNEKNREEIIEKTKVEVFELLKKTIRPEFLNRIDEIVMFNPLSKADIRGIVAIQMENLRELLEQKAYSSPPPMLPLITSQMQASTRFLGHDH